MAKRIILSKKIKDEQGNVSIQEQSHTIHKMTFLQIINITNEFNAIMQNIKDNGDLVTVINGFFKDESLPDGMDAEEFEKLKDQRMMNGVAGGFNHILQHLPEHAMNLLAQASDIPEQDIQMAFGEEVLDLFDAIVEENDIVRLWARVKKSFFNVKDHWAGLVQKATK